MLNSVSYQTDLGSNLGQDEDAKKSRLRKTKSLLTPSTAKKFERFEVDSNRKTFDNESDSMPSRDLELARKDVKKKKRRKKSSGSNSVLAANVTIETSEDVRSATTNGIARCIKLKRHNSRCCVSHFVITAD